jgi:hypothetical protein
MTENVVRLIEDIRDALSVFLASQKPKEAWKGADHNLETRYGCAPKTKPRGKLKGEPPP